MRSASTLNSSKSVLMSSTRFPASASRTAAAHATEVLPTPPLPVKNRTRVGAFRNSMSWPSGVIAWDQQQPVEPQHEPPADSATAKGFDCDTPHQLASISREG